MSDWIWKTGLLLMKKTVKQKRNLLIKNKKLSITAILDLMFRLSYKELYFYSNWGVESFLKFTKRNTGMNKGSSKRLAMKIMVKVDPIMSL
jgi:hypothetical protein